MKAMIGSIFLAGAAMLTWSLNLGQGFSIIVFLLVCRGVFGIANRFFRRSSAMVTD